MNIKIFTVFINHHLSTFEWVFLNWKKKSGESQMGVSIFSSIFHTPVTRSCLFSIFLSIHQPFLAFTSISNIFLKLNAKIQVFFYKFLTLTFPMTFTSLFLILHTPWFERNCSNFFTKLCTIY